MALLTRLKTKKWWVVFILLLVIIIGCGVGAKVYLHDRFRNASQAKAGENAYRQVCSDLLYLEQFDTLKVKPEQAKQILPLMDRLAASDATTNTELAKQIYGLLTPVQYDTLIGSDKTGNGFNNLAQDGRGKREFKQRGNFKGKGRHEDKAWGRKDSAMDPRTEALPNVVMKMLKDRANEPPATTTP